MLPYGIKRPRRSISYARGSLEFRLMRRVQFDTNGGCWLFEGVSNGNRYVAIRDDAGKTIKTHRASWALRAGAIPDGFNVLHRRDVPVCINPAHLFLGTHQENMDDRGAKGRSRGGSLPGEAHPRSKLTNQETIEIFGIYIFDPPNDPGCISTCPVGNG